MSIIDVPCIWVGLMEQEKGHVRESQLKEQFCIMSLGKYVLIWVAGATWVV